MKKRFRYDVSVGSKLDIGLKRQYNQDRVILCPEAGLYAVSDGMGGLLDGERTAMTVKELLPKLILEKEKELPSDATPEQAKEMLVSSVGWISDHIFTAGNRQGRYDFGATACAVWLVGDSGVCACLGDSRAYRLPAAGGIERVTRDHNVAAILVERGELTPEEAQGHPTSSRLTRFVGMDAPAFPDGFCVPLAPGDGVLLCSDGLHGMVLDVDIERIARGAADAQAACDALVEQANQNGGRDNISVVYVIIGGESAAE